MKSLLSLLIVICLIPSISVCQSLGKERMDRLKQSVVKILIDNQASGTGFFIAPNAILTCWHVIEPSFTTTSVQKTITKKITVEFTNGEIVDIEGISNSMLKGTETFEAQVNDYSLLITKGLPKQTVYPLILGKKEDVIEGDRIITAGYPLWLKEQFVSSGIVSTKFVDKRLIKLNNGRDTILNRHSAWLDITMSKGNSGGPVIRLGTNPLEDRVIGIATFIQNPFILQANDMLDKATNSGWDIRSGNFSQTDANKLFSLSAVYASYGISGYVSIDHFNSFLNRNK